MKTVPERWLATMPFARQVAHILTMEEHEVRRRNEAHPKIADYSHDPGDHRRAIRITCDERGRSGNNVVDQRRSTQAVAVAEFVAVGMPVFRIGAELRDVLLHTDLAGVEPSELTLPYYSSYFQIPGCPAIQGIPIDGFLAWQSSDGGTGKAVTLMVCPVDPGCWDADFVEPICVPGSGSDVLTAAMEHADQYKIDDETAITMMAQAGYDATNVNVPGLMADLRERHRIKRHAVEAAQEVLALALNAMLYVDNCRTPQRPQWPDEAPRDLVEKARGRGQKARSATERLSRSWTKIHVCNLPEDEARQWRGEGGSPRQHWRRGHWWRQPHGPGMAQRKRIRIAPTLVRAGDEGAATPPSYDVTLA